MLGLIFIKFQNDEFSTIKRLKAIQLKKGEQDRLFTKIHI